MNIHARNTVSFDGLGSNGFPSSASSGVGNTGLGNGGDINIKTESLSLINGAGLNASSEGIGTAGNIGVTARSIRLDSQGFLTAESVSGRGGNITLQAEDLLLLRYNSEISATSGSLGNGGNINIDTDLLVALENSDIRAHAFAGPGANIQITAQAIFGTQAREQQTPESDITATGAVEVVTPDVDPSQGLATLPAQFVEASRLIAIGCAAVGENEFIVTGRGGLPPNPSDTLSSDTVWTDLRPMTEQAEARPSSEQATQPTNSTPEQMVEAQGWVINNLGEVVLTAHAPNVTPNIPWLTPANCNAPETSS